MMENCKEVVDIIYEFEELIHTKKNGIVWVGGEIRNQQIDYCF